MRRERPGEGERKGERERGSRRRRRSGISNTLINNARERASSSLRLERGTNIAGVGERYINRRRGQRNVYNAENLNSGICQPRSRRAVQWLICHN